MALHLVASPSLVGPVEAEDVQFRGWQRTIVGGADGHKACDK